MGLTPRTMRWASYIFCLLSLSRCGTTEIVAHGPVVISTIPIELPLTPAFSTGAQKVSVCLKLLPGYGSTADFRVATPQGKIVALSGTLTYKDEGRHKLDSREFVYASNGSYACLTERGLSERWRRTFVQASVWS